MTKAYEYKDKFVQTVGSISNLNVTSASKAIEVIGRAFIEECTDLISLRKVHDDIAIYAVLYEQDLKWKTVSRLVNEHYNRKIIKPEGFQILIKDALPELYSDWMTYDAMQKVAQNLRKPHKITS